MPQGIARSTAVIIWLRHRTGADIVIRYGAPE